MPVMGPNLEWARKNGNSVGTVLLLNLIKEHSLFDITKYDNYHGLPDARKNWSKAKENFIKAVEELFVEDACNSF